jgi:YD repeat-containing protein
MSYLTAYAYDGSGRLASITYPSGRTVAYGFDAQGRVNRISTAFEGTEQVVAQNVQYHPFGGVKSYTLGNGQIVARTIDLDGRIAGYTLGNETYALAFDAASRITGIAQTGNPANANTYGYDSLDRLTSAVLPNAVHGYGYDAVGNRLSKSTGAATDFYRYEATSNRLASLTPSSGPARSFVFDANGSTTNDGLNQYTYDTRGRMVGATSALGATAYQVNALGQRVAKSGAQGATLFHYDTRGRLIAETDAEGNLKRELLYLGDIPVAVLQ